MPENKKKIPKHVLIMRLSAIGDVAMIVPLVLGLRQQYPLLKISVLSRPFFIPFFKGIPNINFYAIDVHKKHKGLSGLYGLYKELKQLNIDAFADLHHVMRSKVIRFFFRMNNIPTVSVIKGRAERQELTKQKPKNISPIKSIFERHADVFNLLQIPVSLADINLLPQKKLSAKVEAITGHKNCKWIGIAPFATYNTKAYPIEIMEQVITELAKNKLKLFLFGGGDKEVKILESLSTSCDNCFNMAGKMALENELELISQLDLMLSMDSGNGHMAAMYGVPVITMWGNTHPFGGFAPFRQPLENSLISDIQKYPLLPTSIYGNIVLSGYEDCMKTIDPITVVNKIKDLMEKL